MRFVVDMNLSPEWVGVHWRDIGLENAPDDAIIDWAAREQRIVLTADHDFAAAVAMRGLSDPSVVQLRTGSTDPDELGSFVIGCIARAASGLSGGAIPTIEPGRARLRRGPGHFQATDNN